MALAWALTGSSAFGQATVSSSETRGTQFVFVIDDSRSMREKLPGEKHPAADPDRLSIFAVQALLSMLDPSDEATVVRLNGPRDGATPPPIEPLSENRRRLEALLALDQPLADYAGDYTPCRSALQATRRLLDEAQRDNFAQVVFFLTDGKCTGSDETPDPAAFLADLESHRQGLFRFYLLRFESRPYTLQLVGLAKTTGGQEILVDGADPTGILEPFADALTRSQGYEAELLEPGETDLAAHRGARRIRLLAIAPGEGEPLVFRIADRQGQSPNLLGRTRNDIHRFRSNNRTYRFATVDYRPTDSPMSVRVDGAGDDWKVVAVPEYRLRVEMEVRQGTCAAQGARLRHGIESGSALCATVRLVNERGRPVERAGLGEVDALVNFGTDAASLTPLPATESGELAEFTFQRSHLDPGDYVFEPVVSLTLPGRDEQVTFVGPQLLLQASSLRIEPVPASIDFGPLRPGEQSAPQRIVFNGNFRPTEAMLGIEPGSHLPSCITFRLNGNVRETLSAGSTHTLVARMAPFCGPDSFEGRHNGILRLDFLSGDDGEPLPSAAQIGVSLDLAYRLERPEALEATLETSTGTDVGLRLGGNQSRDFELAVHLDDPERRGAWPGDDLELGFARGEGLIRRDGELALSESASFDPTTGQAALRLRLRADRCCRGGDYETVVAFLPTAEAQEGAYSGEVEPLVLPLRVHVQGGGFWVCRGGAVLWIACALLLLLLLLYVASMFRNTTWLDRGRLADSLTPLRWDSFGSPQRDQRPAGEVRALVDRELRWPQRITTWLRSNPLVIGLPGGSYRETVELSLQPARQVDRSSLRLVAGRDLRRQVEQDPGSWAGRLFASAQRGGVEFYGVPKRGRLGRLTPKRLAGGFGWSDGGDDGEEAKSKLYRLKRREQLIHQIDNAERQDGQPAGWQVG